MTSRNHDWSAALRLSARKAAGSSARFFIAVALATALLILVDRLLDGAWWQSYRIPFLVMGTLSACWFIFLFSTSVAEFVADERLGEKAPQLFPGTMFIKMLCIAMSVSMCALAWGLIHEKDSPGQLTVPALFIALAVFLWPRTIHLTSDSVWQRKLSGGKSVIRYADIASITFDPSQAATVVCSVDGTKIAHCVHRNANLFQEELERRTGKMVLR